MATGTPVVSTDCESGPAEILEYGKYGHLVPVGDENKLSEAILATLDNPLDPHVLQQRSQDFTAETIAQEYLTYFKMLVN
jgi:glycosyltransferase involved in cell wall biosynthesis